MLGAVEQNHCFSLICSGRRVGCHKLGFLGSPVPSTSLKMDGTSATPSPAESEASCSCGLSWSYISDFANRHRAKRLDARSDSVSDHDRPLGNGAPFGLFAVPTRQQSPHWCPGTKRPWCGSQAQLTPGHHDVLPSYDSWVVRRSHGVATQAAHPDVQPRVCQTGDCADPGTIQTPKTHADSTDTDDERPLPSPAGRPRHDTFPKMAG